MGLREYGYAAMPRFEETLTSTIGIVIKKAYITLGPVELHQAL